MKQQCKYLSWSSNKIKCVVKSTTAAEALFLVNGLEEAVYLWAIICNMFNIHPREISIKAITLGNNNFVTKENTGVSS